MGSVVTWDVNQFVLSGLALVLFGIVGFRRGVNRELLSVIGIAIGVMLSGPLAAAVGPQMNRFYKLGRFALGGGLASDDLSAAWQQAKGLPDPFQTPGDTQLLGLVVFLLIALFFLLLGQARIAAPASMMVRFLGGLTGLVNGFMVAHYIFPIAFPDTTAVIMVSSDQVQETLSNDQTIAYVVALLVAVLIAFGLHNAAAQRREK
jgi:uncharacterized membrane protein required for colicin V production